MYFSSSVVNIKMAGMFCRFCGYPLWGLSDNRCPECAWDFDIDDPASYRAQSLKSHSTALVVACYIGPQIAMGAVKAMVLMHLIALDRLGVIPNPWRCTMRFLVAQMWGPLSWLVGSLARSDFGYSMVMLATAILWLTWFYADAARA